MLVRGLLHRPAESKRASDLDSPSLLYQSLFLLTLPPPHIPSPVPSADKDEHEANSPNGKVSKWPAPPAHGRAKMDLDLHRPQDEGQMNNRHSVSFYPPHTFQLTYKAPQNRSPPNSTQLSSYKRRCSRIRPKIRSHGPNSHWSHHHLFNHNF